MNILSIDVGIKNLAYCFIEYSNNEIMIKDWDIINISNNTNIKNLCSFPSSKSCKSFAKFKKNNEFFCNKHAKKSIYMLPNNNFKINKLKNTPKEKLIELGNTFYDLSFNSTSNKNLLVDTIHNYITEKSLIKIEEEKEKNITGVDLGKNIIKEFDKTFKNIIFDHILIENQINPIANKMGIIQGMITQYFLMKNINNIHYISASNKLKIFLDKNQKTTYKERKLIGIEKTKNIINNNNLLNKWIDNFIIHKKKDDLSDSFLQGLWFLNENYKINLNYN
jgi:hypothetical protein